MLDAYLFSLYETLAHFGIRLHTSDVYCIVGSIYCMSVFISRIVWMCWRNIWN